MIRAMKRKYYRKKREKLEHSKQKQTSNNKY